MREPDDTERKMLSTYMGDMIWKSPRKDFDETNGMWVKRVAKRILEREGIDHFLCRRCWTFKGKVTTILWPGICDECDYELRWMERRTS